MPRTTPKKPAARRPRATRKPSAPQVIQLRGLSSPSPWGPMDSAVINAETAIKVTSILAVVRWIAQAMAVMPLQVMRTMPDGRKEAANVPAAYVLRKRPNSWQSAYDFYQLVCYWTALHGNGYARILPGERGWMSELRPMHPTRVRVHRAADYSVWYEFWNDAGRWEQLDSSEVLHWRWLSDNGVYGMPPAELCGTSIGLARRLDQAATAYWDHSGRPDMVVETDEKIPDEAVKALRDAMHQAYGGARNRGKTAVLPKKTRLKTIEQNTMEQSQFQELRDSILADICRCWGVPSTMLGDHKMARWSNVEQEHLSAQVWGLLPWQRRMEGPIDMALQPVYGEDVYCKFDNRGLLRADAAGRAGLYNALWQMGAITPNEMRDLEDLPLLDTPAANQTYVQLGFSTLDNAAAQAATPADPAATQAIQDQVAGQQRSASCRCGSRNCGTGAGGFQSGNSCAKGGGSAGGGSGGDGVGGGDGGGGSVSGSAAGNAGAESQPTPKQKQRKERLRDRIEGTQAEADREVVKAQKKVEQLKKKLEEVKSKLEAAKDPEAHARKVYEQKMTQIKADKEAKIAAAKAKYDAKMAEIKAKYGNKK